MLQQTSVWAVLLNGEMFISPVNIAATIRVQMRAQSKFINDSNIFNTCLTVHRSTIKQTISSTANVS